MDRIGQGQKVRICNLLASDYTGRNNKMQGKKSKEVARHG